MLGSPILYLKGMRAIMFQLSGFYYIYSRYLVDIRRPRGVLDESEVKPPFFPPFRPPKTRAREPAEGRGGTHFVFMEDAEPARSGVDAAGGEFRRL